MAEKSSAKRDKETRDERLKAALKANIQKRKEQARARSPVSRSASSTRERD